ncbi:PEP-CTERM sorting domain-containing protein [Chamaesiphon sp.]|uniref:PEP-CTERM sorting domain-containing protein n=1 Tax=Chamaesiphon sp. TaxID=2814140 RepID=UPI003592F9F5
MFKNNKATFVGASIVWGLTASMSSLTPSAQAVTFTYTETTLGGPVFNRPVDNFSSPPTAISGGAGEAVPYNSFGFTVSAPDSYVFQSTANFDNFTVLYQNSFNPADSVFNAIIANDDIFGLPTGNSGFTVALNTGTNYFLVTTGFDNPDVGTFTNTIVGAGTVTPGTIAAVPEPATILGSLAAFGYGVYSRRKIKVERPTTKKTF